MCCSRVSLCAARTFTITPSARDLAIKYLLTDREMLRVTETNFCLPALPNFAKQSNYKITTNYIALCTYYSNSRFIKIKEENKTRQPFPRKLKLNYK